MKIYEGSNFAEVIAKRRDDAPQAIVAGWFTPAGEPIGAAATVCDQTPTVGEMAVSWACCLAACFKKLDELLAENPDCREPLMRLVMTMTEGLEVVDRFRSGLVAAEALAGCPEARR